MSFGTLALIALCGFAGPLLSASGHGAVPVVVGELLAGILLGRTGFHAIDPSNPTLTFLSEIGFAMLMFAVGMSVLLHEGGLRESLGRGAVTALLVAVIAVGPGLLLSKIGGAGHPAVYAVLIASGSAAVVLPILQERGLVGPAALAVMAQVTIADIGAMVAVPLVLAPARTGRIVVGSAIRTGGIRSARRACGIGSAWTARARTDTTPGGGYRRRRSDQHCGVFNRSGGTRARTQSNGEFRHMQRPCP